jgi:hypothetical protein
MEAVKELVNDDILVLHAPFKPVPLYAVLKAKGYTHDEEEINEKHWKITFTKKA